MRKLGEIKGGLLVVLGIVSLFSWFCYMLVVPGYAMFIDPLFLLLFPPFLMIECFHLGFYFLGCVPLWNSWRTGKPKWYKDKG